MRDCTWTSANELEYAPAYNENVNLHVRECTLLALLALIDVSHQFIKSVCAIERSNKLGVNDHSGQVRSGQVRGHTPQQCVAASTLRRYYFGLRLAIAQAKARPAMPVSLVWDSTWRMKPVEAPSAWSSPSNHSRADNALSDHTTATLITSFLRLTDGHL